MATQENAPNYHYATSGLDVEIRRFPLVQEPAHLTITDIPLADPQHESWTRVQTALETPRREGRVGYIEIPPAEQDDAGTLEIYSFPWGGHSSNPVGETELAAYARAHPYNTILAVDSPATGNSGRLPSAVSREIAKSGSYIPYGEFVIPALEPVLQDYERYIFSGASQGARRAIGAVAVLGDLLNKNTAELHLLDPVGSHRQTLFELAKAFMSREGAHTAAYTAASLDERAAKSQKEIGSLPNFVTVLAHFALHGGLVNQFVREPQAMARNGLKSDLLAALPYVTDTLTVDTPELSELTHVDEVIQLLAWLTKDPLAVQTHPVVEHRTLKGQTHAMIAGHPGALGMLLSTQLPTTRDDN